MTLTTPNCPVADSLPKAKEYIKGKRGVRRKVKLFGIRLGISQNVRGS